MANPSYTLDELASYSGAQLIGDGAKVINGLSTLQKANENQLSFLSNAHYRQYLKSTKAGCVVLSEESKELFSGNQLVSSDPYYTFALLSKLFAPGINGSGITHATAVVGQSCKIGKGTSIGPNAVIGDNVCIADNVSIGAGCYIGDNTVIGEGSLIYPNVSIYYGSQLGKNAIVHSQVVIGADGFGFSPRPDMPGWQKIYQLGNVRIGDDVEIGAGTTIDRGALEDTVIGNGVKLDNQIQVAHNVCIGDDTAIAGGAAIAGSTVIGRRCMIAGAVGIVGHLTITDDVYITAMTLVTKSIHLPGSYSSGVPMNRTSIWRKNAARFNQLDTLAKKLKSQENKG